MSLKRKLLFLSKEVGAEFNTARWIGIEDAEELDRLILAHGLVNAIESGTANGYSASIIASCLPVQGRVITFDPVDRPKIYDNPTFCLKELAETKIEFICKKFGDGVNSVVPMIREQGPILFFIDGDHNTSGVRGDWEAIVPSLEYGDIVVFHDVKGEACVGRHFYRLEGMAGTSQRRANCDARRGLGILTVEEDWGGVG